MEEFLKSFERFIEKVEKDNAEIARRLEERNKALNEINEIIDTILEAA
jgi:hypothetical protein